MMRLFVADLLAVGLLLAACGGTSAVNLGPSTSPTAAGGGAIGSPSVEASATASPSTAASASAPQSNADQTSPSASASASAPPSEMPTPSFAPAPPASAVPPSPASPAPQSPVASPPSATGGQTALSAAVTITVADEGKTFHVKIGQVVDVALKAEQGMANWVVANPNPAILAPTVNPAALAAQGVTLRAFKAAGAGSADITATDRPQCNPSQVCPQLIRGFKATVVVDAA